MTLCKIHALLRCTETFIKADLDIQGEDQVLSYVIILRWPSCYKPG